MQLLRFRIASRYVPFQFPSTTEEIHRHAFAGCQSLLGVEFSKNSSLLILHWSCFNGCPALVNIFLPFATKNVDNHDGGDCQLASKHADGSPFSRMVNIYAVLPIHECCYYASSSTANELENLIEASSDYEKNESEG